MASPPTDTPPMTTFNWDALSGKYVAITGGCGYVGRNIAKYLLFQCRVARVQLFDLPFYEAAAPNMMRDILSPPMAGEKSSNAVASAVPPASALAFTVLDLATAGPSLLGIDAVIHVASFGMSGKAMLEVSKIRRINIGGTERVIAACIQDGCPNLIYISSYNAVFYGQRLSDSPIDVPYPPSTAFLDEYSRTKCEAEKLVLFANGALIADANGSALSVISRGGETATSSGSAPRKLMTVSLRLAGIYGPGEERHFPRIVRDIRSGLLAFTVGGLSPKQEWLHIENLAHAVAVAAQGMLLEAAQERTSASLGDDKTHQKGSSKAQESTSREETIDQKGAGNKGIAGCAFPISDQCPINQWVMLRPIIEACGHPAASIHVPVSVLLPFAWCSDVIHRWLMSVGIHIEPFLTQGEVVKVGVEHYFNATEVRRRLGYTPIVASVDGQRRLLEDITERLRRKDPSFEPTGTLAAAAQSLSVVIGVLLAVAFIVWKVLVSLWIIAAFFYYEGHTVKLV